MSLKKFIPFEKYTLSSKLSIEELQKRLNENVGPKRQLRFGLLPKIYTKPYEGTIIENTFSINRTINYKNSFLPIIKGTFSKYPGQTQIEIKAKLHPFVLVFISVWLGIVGIVCVGMLLIGALKFNEIVKEGFSPMALIPFAMFLFGYLLVLLSFKYESKKSKQFLLSLLEAHEP